MNTQLLSAIDLFVKLSGPTAAIVGIPLLWWQIRQARASVRHMEAARVADLKPYVAVVLKKTQVRGADSVVLAFTNYGRTPALNVRVQFAGERAWHHVSNPNFAFTDVSGITVLAPGETKSYFLGRLVPESEFARVLEEDLLATVSFTSEVSDGMQPQAIRLGLNDNRFGINAQSVGSAERIRLTHDRSQQAPLFR